MDSHNIATSPSSSRLSCARVGRDAAQKKPRQSFPVGRLGADLSVPSWRSWRFIHSLRRVPAAALAPKPKGRPTQTDFGPCLPVAWSPCSTLFFTTVGDPRTQLSSSQAFSHRHDRTRLPSALRLIVCLGIYAHCTYSATPPLTSTWPAQPPVCARRMTILEVVLADSPSD